MQSEPSTRVKEAANFFKQQGLKKILDLGCGTGRHTSYLIDNGFDVYACDVSENAISIAKQTLKEVEFKICDMISLPYKDEFFSGIYCDHVIQHSTVNNIKKAIGEISRVLKKNGILFLTVASTKHPKFLTGEEIETNTKINTDDIDGKIPHHFFTEEEMRAFFKDFDIIKLQHFEGQSELNPTKKSAEWQLYARK